MSFRSADHRRCEPVSTCDVLTWPRENATRETWRSLSEWLEISHNDPHRHRLRRPFTLSTPNSGQQFLEGNGFSGASASRSHRTPGMAFSGETFVVREFQRAQRADIKGAPVTACGVAANNRRNLKREPLNQGELLEYFK
ncbi:macrolide ABC transporter ATP-binding protein [Anopheles sinensis]|uniref:Macrolide ABC transporter ATP-binding protein n=1 Tax=Anopheles sinensis TaxID=74873 RepID=A0A084VKR9_ANOSI|nr:macrolide ABC transporter ATP-binding protein [Anopheles sinensis]